MKVPGVALPGANVPLPATVVLPTVPAPISVPPEFTVVRGEAIEPVRFRMPEFTLTAFTPEMALE
jgi:hypothetical protein